jgi:hypothetical protein
LICINPGDVIARDNCTMGRWQPIANAPFDRDLQLSVIEEGVHALVFPCRRTAVGWVNKVGDRIDVSPSHWRDWPETGIANRC